MAPEALLQITIVHSPSARSVMEVKSSIAPGCILLTALQASGLMENLDYESTRFGIWGREAGLNQLLRENDRIEIYRPLTVDPKVARRERFVKQGARTAGLFRNKRTGAATGY